MGFGQVGGTYISKIENGKLDFAQFPSEQLIRSMAAALEADVDELLLLARKIPEEIKERVIAHPDVFRKIASLDDETLKKLLKDLEDGYGGLMNDHEEERAEDDTFRWWKVSLVFLAVLVFGLLIGVIPWAVFLFRPEWSEAFPDKAGFLGDSFGFVNALLSALAFAGVLVTLWMQRRELQLQRDEMKLTRQELKMTREEHHRAAAAQEGSENRLFVAAYVNALESLRQLSQWRMSADPATTKSATYPVVEGLVVQSRVNQSLQILVRDMEPEIRRIHPAMGIVSEEGSWVWQLERLMSIYLNLRTVLESHGGRSDDPSAFEEAVNIVRVQLERLTELKTACGPRRHQTIDAMLAKAPDPKWIAGDITDSSLQAREARQKYFRDLDGTNKQLLSFIMSMCHE